MILTVKISKSTTIPKLLKLLKLTRSTFFSIISCQYSFQLSPTLNDFCGRRSFQIDYIFREHAKEFSKTLLFWNCSEVPSVVAGAIFILCKKGEIFLQKGQWPCQSFKDQNFETSEFTHYRSSFFNWTLGSLLQFQKFQWMFWKRRSSRFAQARMTGS